MLIQAAVWTCCWIYLEFYLFLSKDSKLYCILGWQTYFPFALHNSVLPQTSPYVARISKMEEILGCEALKQWCGDTVVKGHTSFIVFSEYEIPFYPDSLSNLSSLSTGRSPYNSGLCAWRFQGSWTYQEREHQTPQPSFSFCPSARCLLWAALCKSSYSQIRENGIMCHLKARWHWKCQSEQVLISANVLSYIAICTSTSLDFLHKLIMSYFLLII